MGHAWRRLGSNLNKIRLQVNLNSKMDFLNGEKCGGRTEKKDSKMGNVKVCTCRDSDRGKHRELGMKLLGGIFLEWQSASKWKVVYVIEEKTVR